MSAGLLFLGDPRLTAGSGIATGGLERAVARGEVRDLDSLTGFLIGRLYGAGAVEASFAAAAALIAGPYALPADAGWAALDHELDVRLPSPGVRAASRASGRALRRVVRAVWPHELWGELGVSPHHAVVLGAAATRARLDARGAAVLAATGSVNGLAQSAVSLLSCDPLAVTVLMAEMAGHCDQVAEDAADAARAVAGEWARLPGWGASLEDSLHDDEEECVPVAS